jgi:hypothetical protein
MLCASSPAARLPAMPVAFSLDRGGGTAQPSLAAANQRRWAASLHGGTISQVDESRKGGGRWSGVCGKVSIGRHVWGSSLGSQQCLGVVLGGAPGRMHPLTCAAKLAWVLECGRAAKANATYVYASDMEHVQLLMERPLQR